MTGEDLPTDTKQLFENLMTLDELLESMRHGFSRHAVYKWVKVGLPHEKIRGRLYFCPREVALWLQRTS